MIVGMKKNMMNMTERSNMSSCTICYENEDKELTQLSINVDSKCRTYVTIFVQIVHKSMAVTKIGIKHIDNV